MRSIESVPLKEFLYRKAARNGIPLAADLELSPVCNFNCRMCYIHQTKSQVEAHERSMMQMDEWLSLAAEMKAQGTLYILLTGGEPFLWPDFRKLYEALYKMGFLLSINTNGSLIDEETVTWLKQMPPNRVNITLYGACDETYYRLCGIRGAFNKVVNAIESLQNAGIFVKLNASVTPDNVSDLDAILDFADEHHLIISANTYMYPPVRKNQQMVGRNVRFTPEEAARYRLQIVRHQLKAEDSYKSYLENVIAGYAEPAGMDDDCIDSADGKVLCRAGKCAVWVTWDGYACLCGMIPDFRADLREKGFERSWEEIRRMAADIRLSGNCAKCGDLKMCHSCAAMAYAETGSTEGIPTYQCETMRAMQKLARMQLNFTNI